MPDESTQIGQAPGTDSLRIALSDAQRELDLIYGLERKLVSETHGQARLSRLLRELTRHLGMSYSVLLIPSRRIRIRLANRQWKGIDKGAFDQNLLREVLPKFANVDQPVVLQRKELPHGATGPARPWQMLLAPVRDEHEQPIGLLVTACQAEGRLLGVEAERLLAHFVHLISRIVSESFDRLTGLMRHRDFLAVLEQLTGEEQDVDADHCLVYFDIDQFEAVADKFGSRAGEEVLERFARLASGPLPGGGSLSRIEGDRFAALLRHRDLDAGLAYAEAVRSECQKLVYVRGETSVAVTVSAGVVEINDRETLSEHPLTVARMACSKASDHGGDRVECYDPHDKSIVRRVDNLQVFAQLQDAINQDSFVLDAQPIKSLTDDNAAPHMEVLLRMTGPSGDVLLPEQFFSAAEQYQLMPRLDRYVVSRFFKTLNDFDDLLGLSDATFALNLSGQSLGEPTFHDFVREQVLESQLSPSQLCFEITETAAIANRESAIAFMKMMRGLGCKFALDDFGAGLSSFAYLRDMPVDVLKIDGSFVRDLDVNKVSESMVAAVAQVARVMELKTVAEFVESPGVLAGLKRLGVDYGQGFLLGKPLPLIEQIRALVDTGSFAVASGASLRPVAAAQQ
ncbi:MAG: EAL domain-containing protein [Pseudomonadota bacterium]